MTDFNKLADALESYTGDGHGYQIDDAVLREAARILRAAGAADVQGLMARALKFAELSKAHGTAIGLYYGCDFLEMGRAADTEKAALESALRVALAPKAGQARNDNFVPGVMHCAKCKFRLNRINLNVNVGTVTAGNNKTEPCPNGCGPLWPITWEQEAREGYAALEAMFERAHAAEQALTTRPSAPVLQLIAASQAGAQEPAK